ncbi:MAG: STAS/SEC14 domain-containing protein [Patescibacteria group bacterium]|nr:STAS/SEC14 domain-containing protein [Patescibacteria group bacterium]MDE2589440.1 STAS/SEC14 domain-containing protein [Patescibacteria group bacterium]
MEKRANEIFLNDKGFIESIFHGSQTEETVIAATKQYESFYNQLKKEGKHIFSLVDINDITEANSGARKAVVPILQKVPFEKIAIFGGSTIVKTLAKFMVYVSKNFTTMRYFATRSEAETWLLQEGI